MASLFLSRETLGLLFSDIPLKEKNLGFSIEIYAKIGYTNTI